jgi:hypothetical protein
MKLMSYKDALKSTKEAIKEALVPVRVKRAKKQAELEMLSIEEELATKTADLQEECTKEDLDFKKIIRLQNAIALKERELNQYRDIIDQMFPEDE